MVIIVGPDPEIGFRHTSVQLGSTGKRSSPGLTRPFRALPDLIGGGEQRTERTIRAFKTTCLTGEKACTIGWPAWRPDALAPAPPSCQDLKSSRLLILSIRLCPCRKSPNRTPPSQTQGCLCIFVRVLKIQQNSLNPQRSSCVGCGEEGRRRCKHRERIEMETDRRFVRFAPTRCRLSSI